MKLILILTILVSANIFAAEDSVKKKATEAMNDSKRQVKKAGRALKDKTCELMNGKMECALQRVKHSVQDAVEVVEDAID